MLLEALLEKQRALGMNDRQFADELGISQSLWSLTKNGKRGIGCRILAGTVRRFPELSPHVVLFLSHWHE